MVKTKTEANDHRVLDAKTRDLIQAISDRFQWLSKKKPPSQIQWNIETDDKLKYRYQDESARSAPRGKSEDRDALADTPIGRGYLSACYLNQDLTGARLFIYTNRLYLSDLLNEAANPSSNTTPSTTYFLLRAVMETWAVYLEGLEKIAALPDRPAPNDEESLETFRKDANAIAYLNWSSFSETNISLSAADDLKRNKEDPLKAKNVVSVMKRYDHLVANFEKVYDACCHFIHPSAAIRQIYTERTNPGFGLVRTVASKLDAAVVRHYEKLDNDAEHREISNADGEIVRQVFSGCEKTIRHFEKKAEARLLKLEKKQAKTNKEWGRFLSTRLNPAASLPCFCGSSKTLLKCCAS